jgi:hypothetical protein
MLMERRSVLTHTIRQTEIPALLGSWLKNTPSVKMLCPQKSYLSLYLIKNVSCICVSLLTIGLVLSSVKLCVCGLRQVVVS